MELSARERLIHVTFAGVAVAVLKTTGAGGLLTLPIIVGAMELGRGAWNGVVYSPSGAGGPESIQHTIACTCAGAFVLIASMWTAHCAGGCLHFNQLPGEPIAARAAEPLNLVTSLQWFVIFLLGPACRRCKASASRGGAASIEQLAEQYTLSYTSLLPGSSRIDVYARS